MKCKLQRPLSRCLKKTLNWKFNKAPSTKNSTLTIVNMRQVCKRLQTKPARTASTGALLKYNVCMCQVWEYFKATPTLRKIVCNDNNLGQSNRNVVKCTGAPHQYPRAELWTRNTRRKIDAMVTSSIKRNNIGLDCEDYVYNVAYNAWLACTAGMCGLLRVHTRNKTLNDYVFTMCTDRFMRQQ